MTFDWKKTVPAMLIFALATLVSPMALAADPAVQQIQTFYDGLLDSMKHAKQLGLKGRYEKLKPVVEQTYDFPTMTSLTVGPIWSSVAPDDRQALIDAFERLTVANYAANFDGYDGEKFEVDPSVEVRGTDHYVLSKLVAKSQTVPFTYRMRQTNGGWKVIDVYLEGTISELATRRSDFAGTLSSGGATALVKKINALTDNLMK